MSSEAITRNDLTAILNEVLPPTPSEFRKLLWTNTQGSKTSYSFTANFSEYDEIEVVFDRVGDLITGRMGNSGSATFRMLWANYIVERTATISSGTMTFGNGGAYTNYNSSAAAAGAAYAVPSSVYGIKYERVNPPQAEIADVVIEQGTSDSWTYRKWNSGVAECWERRQIGNITFSSQEGYGYYAGITNRSFPTGLFNADPTITFGVLGGGGLVSFCPSTISNTYYGGYLWCSVNGTRSIAILSHAIGTWK